MIRRLRSLLFSHQSLGQIVLKNTFWLSISQITSRLIRAIVVIYSARVLGAAGYGVFSYAIALAGLLAIFFSDVGINRTLVKEASRSPQHRSHYIATTLVIKLALLIILWVGIVIVAPHFTAIDGVHPLLPIIGGLFVLNGLREFGYAVVRSFERMEIEAGINLLTNVITVVLAWWMLQHQPTPYTLAIAYTIASLLGTVITALALTGQWRGLATSFRSNLVAPLLSEAWPFAIINILWSVLVYTDILMLGWLTNASSVGFYSAAQRPIQLLAVVPVVIAASVLPAMARMAKRDTNRFKQLLEQSIAMVMMLALPLAGGGWAMGNLLITVLYGSSYVVAIPAFQMLSISLIITFPTLVIYHAIFANNLQREFIWQMIAGALLNIVLNYYLILHWGTVGAAAATVIAQFIAYGWICGKVGIRFQLNILPRLYRMIVATALMVGVILVAQQAGMNFYAVFIMAVATYGISLIVMREPLLAWFRSIWLKTQ